MEAHCFGFETGRHESFGGPDFAAGFFDLIFASAAAARSGDYGLEFNSTLAGAGNQTYSIARQYLAMVADSFVIRFYVKFPAALPTGTYRQVFFLAENSNGTVARSAVVFDPADNKLKAKVFNASDVEVSSADGPTIVADQWYRVEAHFNVSAATFDVRIDGVDLTQLATNTGILFLGFGKNESNPTRMYIDDVAVIHSENDGTGSTVGGLYPLGAGEVMAFRPNASGTHNDGGVISPSTGTLADSWQLLDDAAPWLGGATDQVTQTGIDITAYVEYAFEGIPAGYAPNGAMLFAENRQGSFSSNNAQVRTVLDGVETTVHNGLWFGGPAIVVMNTGFVPGSTARDGVNGLLARFGYSSDVTEPPILGAFLLEVDVSAAPEPLPAAPAERLQVSRTPLRWEVSPNRFRRPPWART